MVFIDEILVPVRNQNYKQFNFDLRKSKLWTILKITFWFFKSGPQIWGNLKNGTSGYPYLNFLRYLSHSKISNTIFYWKLIPKIQMSLTFGCQKAFPKARNISCSVRFVHSSSLSRRYGGAGAEKEDSNNFIIDLSNPNSPLVPSFSCSGFFQRYFSEQGAYYPRQ